ncbi:MAG: hypothetical protein Q9183_005862 [Haloplaca sp. 2 TL-2023]
MRCSILYAASSLLALAVAQNRPNPFTLAPDFMINAGEPTTITWEPTTDGTVSIRLRSGASSDLEEGTEILCKCNLLRSVRALPLNHPISGLTRNVTANIPNNGEATVILPADTVRNSDYALQIVSDTEEDQVNYSAPFVVESENTVEPQPSAAESAATNSAETTAAAETSAAAESTAAAMTTGMDSSSMTSTADSTMSTASTSTGSASSNQTMSASSSAMESMESSTPTGTEEDSDDAVATFAADSGSAVISPKIQGLVLATLAGLVIAW